MNNKKNHEKNKKINLKYFNIGNYHLINAHGS